MKTEFFDKNTFSTIFNHSSFFSYVIEISWSYQKILIFLQILYIFSRIEFVKNKNSLLRR